MARFFNFLDRWFAPSAGLILTATAALKIWAVVTGASGARPDPVFTLLTEAQIAVGVAVLELAVAIRCFHPKRTARQSARWVFWLVCCFVCYRVLAENRGSGCHCFGGLFDHLSLASKYSGAFALTLLGYLGVGSLVMLCRNADSDPNPEPERGAASPQNQPAPTFSAA